MRKVKMLPILIVILVVFNTITTKSYAEGEDLELLNTIETDQVIVKLKDGAKTNLKNFDVVSTNQEGIDQIVTVKVPADETINTYMSELNKRDEIESVEPDHLIKLNYSPNDPYVSNIQYHHQKIETARAWDKTLGSEDVIVAVLDNGFDLNHVDLMNQIVTPYNAVSSSYDDLSVDDHGTHVAGIIGSSIDNYQLGAGVAPNTSIMPIDVFDGDSAYTSDVIEGIYQAVYAGADIINMSLGNYYYNNSLNNAVQFAYQNGLVIVAAAGNDATDLTHYPSSYENVISVGSTTSEDTISYFSNYGQDIDISAPGSSIFSTLPGNSFGNMSGTSMASPVIAGVVALIKASEPQLSNAEIANRLYSTSDDLGDYGKDSYFGNGRVNAKQALLIKDIPVPTVTSVYDYSRSIQGYIPYEIEGASVTILNQAGEIIAYDDGYSSFTNFTLPMPQQIAGTRLYVVVSDMYGNKSEKVEVVVKDGTPPSKPIVKEVTDQSTVISGTAEPKSKLSVSADQRVIYSSFADSSGTFSIPIDKLKAGSNLAIVASDIAGNNSESTQVVVKDVTAPNVPTVNDVTETSTSITGTAEMGSSITVNAGTTVIGTATTTTEGKYSVTILKQKAGTKLAITAMDKAGNKSIVKEVTVKDIVAPIVPTVKEVTDASTSVSGTAETSSTIIIKTGTTIIGTGTTTNEGKYSVSITKQKAGTKLAVTAKDASGNVSLAKEVTVIDKTAPAVPIVSEVTNKSTSITGTAEVSSTVVVKAGSITLGSAKASIEGKFNVTISSQSVGTELTVTSIDTAGNVSAVSNVTIIKAPAEKTDRLAGLSRYSTAVAISKEGWATSDTVVLATGADFPDALAGGPLAYKVKAPILLTKSASLLAETEEEIIRLKAKKVIILGSKGAISLEVEAKLNQMGITTERIGGKNRFDTAALIAKRLPSTQAVIAYGFNFPDVLSISPYAAKNGVPILLTRSDRVPSETINAMSGKTNTIIVGSTGAINDSVMNQFPKPVRYGGINRFETGKIIITKLPMGTGNAYVATGKNFPDALAGSVIAAFNDAPILLVNGKVIPTPTNDLISKYNDFTILGSLGAVGDEVKVELDRVLSTK